MSFFKLNCNFNFDLSNDMYRPLNLKSYSTIFNTYSLVILILIIVLIHISAICLMKKLADRCDPSGKCSKCICVIQWIINKAYNLMLFDFYIRKYTYSNQFLLVCSIYEINRHDTSKFYRAISFGYAILVLIICLLANLSIFWLSLMTQPQTKQEDNKFRELFKGINTQKKARFHVGVIILRKTIFIVALVCIKFCSYGVLIGSLCIVQLIYLAWVVAVRPYSEVKSNIIEITNEILFSLCFGVLLFVHKESSWNSNNTNAYICVIMFGNITTFVIVLVDFMIKIIAKCISKCTKPSSDEDNDISRVRPKSPRVIEVGISQNTRTQMKNIDIGENQRNINNREERINENMSNIRILSQR